MEVLVLNRGLDHLDVEGTALVGFCVFFLVLPSISLYRPTGLEGLLSLLPAPPLAASMAQFLLLPLISSGSGAAIPNKWFDPLTLAALHLKVASLAGAARDLLSGCSDGSCPASLPLLAW